MLGKVHIMVFLAIDSDTDIKTSSFHQSRKPRPVSHEELASVSQLQ